MTNDWLERTELLLGGQKLALVRQAHVLVVGLGGVGAYAAEMLTRSGIGRLTIVDADCVSPSNLNRQLVALHSTIGRTKAEVLAERLCDINPQITLDVVREFIKDDATDALLALQHSVRINVLTGDALEAADTNGDGAVNANDALLVWYRAAEDALLCMGLSSLPGEAPASFLWRAQCELHDAVKLTGLGKALCVAQYSGRTLKPIQPERARKVYAELLAQMTFRQRLRLYVRRLIHGLRLS